MRFCQCDDTDSAGETKKKSVNSKMYLRKAISATLHVKIIDLVINHAIISMTQILRNTDYYNYMNNDTITRC